MHIYTNESEIVKKVNAIAITLTTCNQEQYTSKIYISNENTFTIYAAELQSIYMIIYIVIVNIISNKVIQKVTIFINNQISILLVVEFKTQSEQYILKRIVKKINQLRNLRNIVLEIR